MSRVDPAAARWVEYVVLMAIMLMSLVTGFVGTIIILRHAREGTLIFKDLNHPAMVAGLGHPAHLLGDGLQALDMLVKLTARRVRVAMTRRGCSPGSGRRKAVSWGSILGLMFASKVDCC